MNKEQLEKCIRQLEVVIADLSQAAVLGGRTQKESEAFDLLLAARLKLIEELEAQTGGTF